ncbi:MAG TPA: TIGR02587 family membrane protein [Salinimicrobium sp.]|nr:TIGR02587 family membrane protein [Salinimicrobium sp.]
MLSKSSKKTLKEYGRGIIGGLLFSLPLLYTMEVWWTGFTVPPSYLLVCIIVTFFLLLGFNTYSGMRKDSSFFDVFWDSIEEIALALVVSFLFLLLIRKIGFTMSFYEIAGKVIVESMIVAIGISVGTAQMGQSNNEDSGMDGEDQGKKEENNKFVKLIVLSVCGAVLFSSSVAPTEEILMIAIQSTISRLLFMIVISLVLIFVTLYFSNFKGSKKEKPEFMEMFFQATLCYLSALIVSYGFLYFFGRVAGHGLFIIIAQVIVLGVPAAIGAAVGRLLIKGN